jgi:hypothetical protein
MNDNDFLSSPEQWPGDTLLRYCCLRRKVGSVNELAYMVHMPGLEQPKHIVHLGNIFDPMDVLKGDVITFDSISDILAAGWFVD